MIKFKWVKDDREDLVLYEKTFGQKSKKRRNFVINWEKNLDWNGNPFVDNILLPLTHFKAGRDDEINALNKFFIQDKKFGILKGEKGLGKTFLLKWLEEELNTFQNKFKIFYFDAKISNHKMLVKKLIKHFSSFSMFIHHENILETIKSHLTKSKNAVFIIDNADHLNKESLDLLNKIISFNYTSMIFSITKDIKFKDFPDDELNLILKPMKSDSLKEMIIKRIEHFNGIDIEPFNSIQLKTIAKRASNNPREFLKLCNEKAVEISLQKKDTIDPFETLEVFEVEDEKEIVESLPDGILEGDMIVQEIVGEFNIDNLEKKENKKSKKK